MCGFCTKVLLLFCIYNSCVPDDAYAWNVILYHNIVPGSLSGWGLWLSSQSVWPLIGVKSLVAIGYCMLLLATVPLLATWSRARSGARCCSALVSPRTPLTHPSHTLHTPFTHPSPPSDPPHTAHYRWESTDQTEGVQWADPAGLYHSPPLLPTLPHCEEHWPAHCTADWGPA